MAAVMRTWSRVPSRTSLRNHPSSSGTKLSWSRHSTCTKKTTNV